MGNRIDLNADLGEGSASDAELMKIVTSASIACGGHAGDEAAMNSAIVHAIWSGVRIGAHPSYPDRESFGRKSMKIAPHDLLQAVSTQIDALKAVAQKHGVAVSYVKPHGALYNDALDNKEIAAVIAEACQGLSLPVMTMPGGALSRVEEIDLILEGFADRDYTHEGRLASRAVPSSIIEGPELAATQAVSLAERVDSICVHSDTPNAVQIARAVRASLENNGYEVSADHL